MDIYSQISSFDTIYQAYVDARRGKRYRPEVVRYSLNLEENLLNIHNHLQWQSWEPGAAREFVVLEPKMRCIQAPPFCDRIVHHALVDTVTPLFEKRFIYHSYACRTGKGTHAAVAALQKMLRQCQRRWGDVWVVQADVKTFFASVDHATALTLIAKTIKCDRTLALWDTILKGYGHDGGVGIPVGALTSQLTANIVLDAVDHTMADEFGAGRYLRYMDDIIILTPCKESARQRLVQLRCAIEELKLELNRKTQVRRAVAGIDWCGYRTWATHILPRKRNIKRMRRRIVLASRAGDSVALHRHRCCLVAYVANCCGYRSSLSALK